MEELDEKLARLVREVLSVPEHGMRRALLAAKLASAAPEEIAALLDILYRKNPRYVSVRRVKALLVDPEALMEVLGPEKYRQTYLAAIEGGFTAVSRLFTDLPPQRSGPYGYDKEEEAKMEFISLGQRRSLAKTHLKDTLDRLLSDPDPMVIANILGNPRITERDAVKIASKRPNSPRIIRLLATHPKWSKRYAVAKAVVRNPYTPPRIAVGLLEFLLTQDLKAVSADGTLHPQVRMGARELLAERES